MNGSLQDSSTSKDPSCLNCDYCKSPRKSSIRSTASWTINRNSAQQLSLNDIGREALTLYKWAVDQTEDGLAVVATDRGHSNLVQIATPALPARPPRR